MYLVSPDRDMAVIEEKNKSLKKENNRIDRRTNKQKSIRQTGREKDRQTDK